MSEETDSAGTVRTVLAGLRTIAGGVEPALEYAVSELARVAALAMAFSEIRAGIAGVFMPQWIPPASLLTGVGVRTFGPVM